MKRDGISLGQASYELIEATEVIDMGEAPGVAIRKKRDASISIAAKQVKEGKAQGLVAAGSTGAAMAAAVFKIGRIPGVERPAIGIPMPSMDIPCLLLDAGANADCTANFLQQFAHMGRIYMQQMYSLSSPEVGLLNIGTEPGKGSEFSHEVFDLFKADSNLNFVGNVEGRNIFLGGCHVAVTDGFTGNVALKSAEGVATLLSRLLKREATSSFKNKLIGLLAKPLIKKAYKVVDHEEFGGALLLGINGTCVIAHGGSSNRAIVNAIRVAKQGIEAKVVEGITDAIQTMKALDTSSAVDLAPA